jgi:hypothetical protein
MGFPNASLDFPHFLPRKSIFQSIVAGNRVRGKWMTGPFERCLPISIAPGGATGRCGAAFKNGWYGICKR